MLPREFTILLAEYLLHNRAIFVHLDHHHHHLLEKLMADLSALKNASDALATAAARVSTDAPAAIAALQAQVPSQADIDAVTSAIASATTSLDSVSSALEAVTNPGPVPPTV